MLTQALACPDLPALPVAAGVPPAQRLRREHAIAQRDYRGFPRKTWERELEFIVSRVSAGSVRVATPEQFLDAVRACPAFAGVRADRWESLIAVATALAALMDWQLSTSRPTWEELQRRSGRSRRTVARILRAFRDAGLVGVVATGRSAGTDPDDPEEPGAFAAVYVLCAPGRLQAAPAPAQPEPENEAGGAGPVIPPTDQVSPGTQVTNGAGRAPGGTSGTPSLLPSKMEGASVVTKACDPRTRAREARCMGDRELVAGGPWADAGVPLRTKEARILGAHELRRRSAVLRRASTPAVAAMCRELFLSGATVLDIMTMLEHRPDGSLWPHSMTSERGEVRHVAGWVRHRLLAWRTDPRDPRSPLRPTPSQRSTADSRAAAARAAERATTEAQARAAAIRSEDSTAASQLATELAATRVHAARFARSSRRATTGPTLDPAPAPAAEPVPTRPWIRRAARTPIEASATPQIAALRAGLRRV